MNKTTMLSVLALVGCGSSATDPATPPDDSTITLTMSPFVVPPGGEVYRCQNFANPIGAELAFDAIESHMSAGSHHLAVFYRDDIANGPVEECSGLEFSAGPFATQLRDDQTKYPAGIAAVLDPKQGIRLNAHYVNTTSQELTPSVSIKIHKVPANAQFQRAGTFTMTSLKIDVPAFGKATIPVDCTAPDDMNILSVTSHMHKHGVAFRSDVSGETLYASSTWDDPPRQVFDPSRLIKKGSKVHFECDFVNGGDTPLTFGESAATNEMCVLLGQFYPYDTNGQVALDCSPPSP
jgi:hypothetical protein